MKRPDAEKDEPEAVEMSFTRVKQAGSIGDLVPSKVAVYRVLPLLDRDTSKLQWPQKLSLPDMYQDEAGTSLYRNSQKHIATEDGIPTIVKMTDLDKPYRTESNALIALSQPLSVSERDRTSELSVELYEEIWRNKFKDHLQVKKCFPVLDAMFRGEDKDIDDSSRTLIGTLARQEEGPTDHARRRQEGQVS